MKYMDVQVSVYMYKVSMEIDFKAPQAKTHAETMSARYVCVCVYIYIYIYDVYSVCVYMYMYAHAYVSIYVHKGCVG